MFMMGLEPSMINHSKCILWHVLFFMSVSLRNLLDVRNNNFLSTVCISQVLQKGCNPTHGASLTGR